MLAVLLTKMCWRFTRKSCSVILQLFERTRDRLLKQPATSQPYPLAIYTASSDRTGAAQINDRYEFPDELDLDLEGGKWLSENADKSVRNLYKLHSVLVHSGGVHGGHYYAYIQPDCKRWLKFDDERVRCCLEPSVCL